MGTTGKSVSVRRSYSRTRHLLGLTGLLWTGACSLDNGSAAGTGGAGPLVLDDSESNPDSSFGTSVLIGPPGNQVGVAFKPVAEPTAKPGDRPAYFPSDDDEALPTTQSTVVNTPPGLKWLDDRQNTGAGGAGGSSSLTSPAASTSAWSLVYGAATECLRTSAKARGASGAHPALGDIKPVVPSWSKGADGQTAWAIFPSPPTNCEQLLAMEETLLCTADKLAQIADTLAPITWHEAGQSPPPGFPTGDWVIPPQKPQDQFVTRDLALHLLANLATTDPRKFKVSGTAQTCADLFAKAVSDPSFATSNASVLFGAPVNSPPAYFPPQVPVTQDNVKDVAAGRLLLETQILQGANQLTFDTMEKNVSNVESVARSNRAKASDPVEGGKSAWGVSASARTPYNTFAHSLRAAGGRLEMGSGSPDRACQGTAALDLLRDGYGVDASADYEDETVQTEDQARAMRLVESSGIVFPTSVIAATSPDQLKEALTDQLVGLSAIEQGLPPDDADYRTKGAGQTIAETVAHIHDEDLGFALRQSNRVARRLTSSDGNADLTKLLEKFPSPDYVSPKVSGAGGGSIRGGTGCGTVPSSRRAQLLRAESASACEEYRGANGAIDPDLAYSAPFQSGFALGQSLYRRMVVARENARNVGLTGEGSVTQFAEIATAQARAWAGSSRMMVSAPTGTEVGTVTVKLIGVEPEQFGITDLADLKDQVALTAGPAWTANCATGAQEACPKDFQTAYVVKPSAIAVDKAHTDMTQNRKYGTDGGVVTLTFDTGKLASVIKYNERGVSDEPLYLVWQDTSNNGQGIFGAARAVAGKTITVEIMPPARDRQREGLDRGDNGSARPGDNCGNSTRDVCTKGLLKNKYITVQNDLTGGNDPNDSSWRYYLSAARQAAEKTDQLGREALQELLEIDFRREGSGEQLAAICGDYGALGDIQFSGGSVSSKNSSLQSCLSEKKYDIVFLTDDPLAEPGLSEEKYKQILLNTLRCEVEGAASSNPLCKVAKGPEYKKITHAGLGLGQYGASTRTDVNCDSVLATVDGVKDGSIPDSQWKAIHDAAIAEWTQPQFWLDNVRSLELAQNLNGRWQLSHSKISLMDSDPKSSMWPGCRYAGGAGKCDESAVVLQRTFVPHSVSAAPCQGDSIKVGNSCLGALPASADLLWSIQGVLWLMGAVAGEFHEGMFSIPVPVADLNAPEWGEPSATIPPALDKTHAVPALASYHGGIGSPGGRLKLQTQQGENVYYLDGNSNEQSALGTAHAIDTSLLWPPLAAPLWHKDMYKGGGKYKYVLAHNAQIQPPQSHFQAIGELSSWLESTRAFASVFPGAWKTNLTMAKNLRLTGDAKISHTVRQPGGSDETRSYSYTDVLCQLSDMPWLDDHELKANQHVSLGRETDLRYVLNFLRHVNGDETWNDDNTNVVRFKSPNMGSAYITGPKEKTAVATCGYQSFLGPNDSGDLLDQRCLGLTDMSSYYVTPDGKNGSVTVHPQVPMLSPSVCGPGKRLPAFINKDASSDDDALQQLTQALSMQCYLSSPAGGVPITAPAPAIKSLEAMPLLYAWVSRQVQVLNQQISLLHIEHVPDRLVNDFAQGLIGSGATSGQYGSTLLETEQSLQSVMQGWIAISKNLQLLNDQIRIANLRIRANDLQEQSELKSFALQNLQIEANIAQSAIRAVASAAAGIASAISLNLPGLADSGVDASSSAVSIYYGEQEKKIVEELKNLAAQKGENNVLQIIFELHSSVETIYADLNQALSMTRAATAAVRSSANRLDELSQQAKYQAAKANSLGFFNGAPLSSSDYTALDGRNVALPVNTVLRRQIEVGAVRYQVALQEARELACIARLSLEQKLGLRLSDLKAPVGPYAPASWADDVSLMKGLDYNALRNSFSPNQVVDPNDPQQQKAGQLADLFNVGVDLLASLSTSKQFVGDYIDRLENFATFYNVQYPSQSGSDTAILSLANDILAPTATCTKQSPNLLYFSGDLSKYVAASDSSQARGWLYGPCSPDLCVQAFPGTSLSPPLQGPLDEGDPQQSSVLVTFANPAPDAPLGDEDPLRGSVWQSVALNAGHHVVSWWAQARGKDGKPTMAGASLYAVTLLYRSDDGTLKSVASQQRSAHLATDTDAWGSRQSLAFEVDIPGQYIVAFRPVVTSENPFPSVAIAAAQLEATNDLSNDPIAYSPTSAQREVSTGVGCSTKAVDVRNAFDRRCASTGVCYYVLKKPFSLRLTNKSALLGGNPGLSGKFALGNANYRHGTIALNLVGTAVHHCDESSPSSCYGSLYEQFSLAHLANPVPVLNALGKPPLLFNFGRQVISDAKALTAERFLTVPISSSDQSSLSQAGLERGELKGRPLDGDYLIFLKDSPSLQWNRLEDVQIVLHYTYWTPATTSLKNSP